LTGPMGAGPIAILGSSPGKGAAPDPADVLGALDRLGSAP